VNLGAIRIKEHSVKTFDESSNDRASPKTTRCTIIENENVSKNEGGSRTPLFTLNCGSIHMIT